MKTNSNSSIVIGKKYEDRPDCNNQYVSIESAPGILFSIFLWMMALGLVVSGPLTGCHKDEAIPVYTTSTAIQNQLTGLIQEMNLASVVGVNSNPIIKKGDLIGLGYHDDFYNDDLNLKINDDLSTKDKMVFDGTKKNLESGQMSYLRYTATSVDGAVVLKKQRTQDDKPISANSPWANDGTFKYVPTEGGVAEYQLSNNGTFVYVCTYVPKTPTSMTKTYNDASANYDLTGVSVVTK